jgi:hypothetical protein
LTETVSDEEFDAVTDSCTVLGASSFTRAAICEDVNLSSLLIASTITTGFSAV